MSGKLSHPVAVVKVICIGSPKWYFLAAMQYRMLICNLQSITTCRFLGFPSMSVTVHYVLYVVYICILKKKINNVFLMQRICLFHLCDIELQGKNVQARLSSFPQDLGQCYLLLVRHLITGGDCAARDNLLFVTLSAFSFLLLFFNESLSEVG